MSDLQLLVEVRGAREPGAEARQLHAALRQVFPEAAVTIEPRASARGAVRTRGASLELVEFLITLALHAALALEVCRTVQTVSETLETVKALLRALGAAGVSPSAVKVKVKADGAFEPLARLLDRLGLTGVQRPGAPDPAQRDQEPDHR